MRSFFRALLPVMLVAVALTPHQALAQNKLTPIKFSDTRLSNGLRILVVEDHYAPIYAICVAYGVGSKDEVAGRTGFAHLFEHMMFKGSENVGPGEHFFTVFNYGGNMNGTTNSDRTVYFETMPKNQLDAGLFLESDRMRSLAITAENLENQRQAVKEERRLRMDNQAYGPSSERLNELLFDGFAYHHSVIGSMADLDAATVDDVKEFFRIYYAPNNAALAIVGDVDTKEVLAKAEKYFGNIPRQSAPKPADLSEPGHTKERKERIEDKLARVAQVTIAYTIPSDLSPDMPGLDALAMILGQGDSSRLYQKLVKEKQICSLVGANDPSRLGPGSFQVTCRVAPGKTIEEAESLIEEEITNAMSAPVTDAELKRVRTAMRRRDVAIRTSVLGRAQRLAEDAIIYNDPNRINTSNARIATAIPADIQRVARQYLKPENRVILETVPAGQTPAPR
jgi:zinc protease